MVQLRAIGGLDFRLAGRVLFATHPDERAPLAAFRPQLRVPEVLVRGEYVTGIKVKVQSSRPHHEPLVVQNSIQLFLHFGIGRKLCRPSQERAWSAFEGCCASEWQVYGAVRKDVRCPQLQLVLGMQPLPVPSQRTCGRAAACTGTHHHGEREEQ